MKRYGYIINYKGKQLKGFFDVPDYFDALTLMAWNYPGAEKIFFDLIPEDEYKNVIPVMFRKKPFNGNGGNIA